MEAAGEFALDDAGSVVEAISIAPEAVGLRL
jgi:hypothetical protein